MLPRIVIGMDVEANAKIGHCLREIRLHTSLTQVQLAAKLGKPQSYVSKIESGERALHVSELFKYAAALGMSAEALVKRIEKYAPDRNPTPQNR